MTERYAGDNITPYELVAWYARALQQATDAATTQHIWHWARFSDGSPVPRAARLLLRQRPDVLAAFPDPFAAVPGGFRAWLAETHAHILEPLTAAAAGRN